MTVELPNWILVLIASVCVIWIFAGIAMWKAAAAIREKHGGYLWSPPPLRGPFQPPQNPYDDADWWKKG